MLQVEKFGDNFATVANLGSRKARAITYFTKEVANIKATPCTLGKIIFHRIKSGDAALRDQMLALARSVEPCKEFGVSAIEDLVRILGHDVKEYG
jgi:hypothetical protein